MFASANDLECPFDTNDSIIADRVQCRSSLIFLISKAFKQSFNENIRVLHHIGNTTFINFANGRKVTENDAINVYNQVRGYINSGNKIEFSQVNREELVNYFLSQKKEDKAEVTSKMGCEKVIISSFDGYIDYVMDPMKGDLSSLCDFKMDTHEEGILRLSLAPPLGQGVADGNYPEDIHKLSVQKRKFWEERGVSNLLQLNRYISSTPFNDVKAISEDLHTCYLDRIADQILSMSPKKRVISIAGPSSSGKTTLSKPIKRKIEEKGYKCVIIETDDYFVDRADMIPNAQGKLEFESINAVLTKLLGERIEILLSGGNIPVRKFDFFTGTGNDQDKFLEVGVDGYVIVEGIHGVNPDLLCNLGKERPYTVYVAPLTPISIDNEHVISLGDVCLLRRILRDKEERGYSPRLNVMWWNDVREGEELNIVPYVKDADIIFDSSFCFELHMMQPLATKILKDALVPEDKEAERDSKFRSGEIQRFLRLFSVVDPLILHRIPTNHGVQSFTEKIVTIV